MSSCNFEVSVVFSVIEAIVIGFIAYRSKTSQDPWIRAQKYCLPVLCSIWIVEVVEALLWLDTKLKRVDDPIDDETSTTAAQSCSAYNQRLTFVIWNCVIPILPFLIIYPLRRVGNKRNYDFLKAVEGMTIFLMAMHWVCYLYQQVAEIDEGYESEPPRKYIQAMNYGTYANSETCSYIGKHNHLFYTLDVETDWVSPNGVSFGVFGIALPFAKPWRLGSGLVVPMSFVLLFVLFYYDFSPEVISIICRLGIVAHIYFVIQPYVLPCAGKYEYWDYTMLDEEDSNETKTQASFEQKIKSS